VFLPDLALGSGSEKRNEVIREQRQGLWVV